MRVELDGSPLTSTRFADEYEAIWARSCGEKGVGIVAESCMRVSGSSMRVLVRVAMGGGAGQVRRRRCRNESEETGLAEIHLPSHATRLGRYAHLAPVSLPSMGALVVCCTHRLPQCFIFVPRATKRTNVGAESGHRLVRRAGHTHRTESLFASCQRLRDSDRCSTVTKHVSGATELFPLHRSI